MLRADATSGCTTFMTYCVRLWDFIQRRRAWICKDGWMGLDLHVMDIPKAVGRLVGANTKALHFISLRCSEDFFPANPIHLSNVLVYPFPNS